MKNTKKLLTAILIAAFFLTITTQTDALALSLGSIGSAIDSAVFQPIKNNVVTPIANFISPNVNPIVEKFKETVVDPVLKVIWEDISDGVKETFNLAALAITDPTAFHNELRRLGYNAGIYKMSDEDFIRNVTGNARLRQALRLLLNKTPDVFNWIKKNLVKIKIENDLGNYPRSLGRGQVPAHFDFSKGRTIAFRRDMIDGTSAEEAAETIVHEVAHLVNFFDGDLKDIRRAFNPWEEEYKADSVSTRVADRLGIGAGWHKAETAYITQINETDITVTDELQNWNPGDRSTGGYWDLITTALRGTRTAIQKVLPSSSNDSVAQTVRSYITEQVEVDLATSSIKVIGSSTTTRTFLIGQDGTLKVTDKTKDNNIGKEATSETEINILSHLESNTYNPDGNVTITPVAVLENADGTTTFSISRINGSGDTITASVIIDKNGEYAQHVADSQPSAAKKLLAYTPNPTDANAGTGNTQSSSTQTIYDASGKFVGTSETIVDAAGNTTTTYTDANGRTTAATTKTANGVSTDRPISYNDANVTYDDQGRIKGYTEQKTSSANRQSAVSTKTVSDIAYDNQGKLIGYTEQVESSANGKAGATTYSKYSSITLPPVGGPQGGIAPDVVNPVMTKQMASSAAGEKK